MKISILHFEHNAEDTKTFKESTDIKLKNLFDVPFDVYHHDKVWLYSIIQSVTCPHP